MTTRTDEPPAIVGVDAADTPTLRRLRAARILTDADVHVTDTIARLTGERDPGVLLAIALAVRAPAQGHVCLELDRVVADGLAAEGEGRAEVVLPEPRRWRRIVAASPAVRSPSDHDRVTPLVLDRDRLYLERYWRYEQRLLAGLERLVAADPPDHDPAQVTACLDRLFPSASGDGPDLQRRAAEVATRRAVTIITGGPGTGKTTTVVKLLAALLLTAPQEQPLRLVVTAPTGKAAARLAEAVRDAVDGLDVPSETAAALRAVPATTLHRLLGWRPDQPSRFRHDHMNRLPVDVVVVDEASMASLALMSKLVDALDDRTRLILVGDREQLTSVDAGAVLGDLCAIDDAGAVAGGASGTSADRVPAAEVSLGAALQARTVALTRYYRFGAESGIGAVSRAIRRGAAGEVLAMLRGERTEAGEVAGYDDLALLAPAGGGDGPGLPAHVWQEVLETARQGVELAFADADPGVVLTHLETQRVLAALRRGPDGVEALNQAIERRLARLVPGYDPNLAWPLGRPLLVTHNDHALGLYNGDVGVVVRDPSDPDRRRVAFPTPEGGVRLVAPGRVPPSEPVFALSVHKSQGSQFAHVVLVLPRVGSPLLSRELVYTGVTRASRRLTVVADEGHLAAALDRRVQRASGLRERLWSPAPVARPG